MPIASPSTDTSICSGMEETSASSSMEFSSWVTRLPGTASPVTITLTSTTTFSPREITSMSMCSM